MTEDTPKLLWSPQQQFIDNSNLCDYMQWLQQSQGQNFNNYESLWEWSTNNLEEFWLSIWDYFDIISHSEFKSVLSGDHMPHYKWFEGAKLNYAEHVFRNATTERPALIFKREGNPVREISWEELKSQVSGLQHYLKTEVGITAGDRVVGYLPTSPEATAAFLAANSLGAVWSSCSPDFGISSVIDRFSQVSPRVLITIDGYSYGGKSFDKSEFLKEISNALPSLEKIIIIPYLNEIVNTKGLNNVALWHEAIVHDQGNIEFEAVPFSHPMWVLYSSGTTGIPKAITHSQGGILMEHLKFLAFHNNVKPGDRCFWYTTTGWMMWNYIQSALLCGGTVVLYDGSPAYPKTDALWQFAEDVKITHLGTSAGYIIANMKEGTRPGTDFDLSNLVSIGSTGSPLPPEGFDWIYKEVKRDLWLTSISGGTDVCSAFVGGNPLWPVYSGEIQCRALGCKLESYDDNGSAVLDTVGEMVITAPMPSMPIYFWKDEDFLKYKSSYFEMYTGVWRHGDWTKITPRNGVVIYGRSDSTLNRGGVRIGTSEVYRAVDKIVEVKDSMIICIERNGGEYYMPLFVVLDDKTELTPDLIKKIKTTIRSENTPRHVPDDIIKISEVPYTISGKKTETPVKRILMGQGLKKNINTDALKNPDALNFFIEFANQLNKQ